MRLGFARFIARTLPHLALFAVMLLAFASESGTYWQCEGRPCGANAWTCCCTATSSGCETSCAPHPNTSHLEPKGAHAGAGGCHCSAVNQDSGKSPLQRHFSFFPQLEMRAALPAGPRIEVPLDAEVHVPAALRGPPLLSTALTTPSLRAPPLS